MIEHAAQLHGLKRGRGFMNFFSTRNADVKASFREAVFHGLAPDGGLFHPEVEPDLRKDILAFDEESSFQDIASRITARLLPEEFSEKDAAALCERAFPFSPALKQISEDMYLLELFHGPSCAFKDFGASYLANVMELFLEGDDGRAVILTATSGDTGSAVAGAFYGKKNIDVVILYPSGRVSPLQEKQLTTHGGNISALEVQGSFDDCQRMVKEAFLDPELAGRLRLTSANSINLGRLIPQTFYYIYGFSQLKHRVPAEVFFCVPSGNFGNLTAGLLAWRWGMPATGFVAATNRNDVVPEYLDTGIYRPRPSVHTMSNAMDVGNPSNFERMQQIFGSDLMDMRAMVTGIAVSDEETAQTMKRYYVDRGIFLDPHTAAGVYASRQFLARSFPGVGRVITLGTAHPGKFGELVSEATGCAPDLPERLSRVLDLPKKSTVVENSLEALRSYLLDHYA